MWRYHWDITLAPPGCGIGQTEHQCLKLVTERCCKVSSLEPELLPVFLWQGAGPCLRLCPFNQADFLESRPIREPVNQQGWSSDAKEGGRRASLSLWHFPMKCQQAVGTSNAWITIIMSMYWNQLGPHQLKVQLCDILTIVNIQLLKTGKTMRNWKKYFEREKCYKMFSQFLFWFNAHISVCAFNSPQSGCLSRNLLNERERPGIIILPLTAMPSHAMLR